MKTSQGIKSKVRKPILGEYGMLNFIDSLFNAQDLLVLQDLESFSQNMGLGTDWALPSEPSVVQIVSELNTHIPATSQRPSSSDQTLSQLPIEKESVGKYS